MPLFLDQGTNTKTATHPHGLTLRAKPSGTITSDTADAHTVHEASRHDLCNPTTRKEDGEVCETHTCLQVVNASVFKARPLQQAALV